MSNPFSQRMRNLSDSELSDMLISPKQYQPEAIEAAKLELESRGIDIALIEEDVSVDSPGKQRVLENFKYKIKTLYQDYASFQNKIVESHFPKVKIIVILFHVLPLLSFLYSELFIGYGVIPGILNDTFTWLTVYGLGMIFIDLVVRPIGYYLFWKEKRWGFIILIAIIFRATAGMLIKGVSQAYIFFSDFLDQLRGYEKEPMDLLSSLDLLTVSYPLSYYLIQILYILPLLMIMLSSNMRERFKINLKIIKTTLIIVLLLEILLFFLTRI